MSGTPNALSISAINCSGIGAEAERMKRKRALRRVAAIRLSAIKNGAVDGRGGRIPSRAKPSKQAKKLSAEKPDMLT